MTQPPVESKQHLGTVSIRNSQIYVAVAMATILFGIINYIDKRVQAQPVIPNDVVTILTQQAAILSGFQMIVNQDHELLMQRTPIIASISADAAANKQMLISLTSALAQQTTALTEQTKVLQKLSVWLDIQIADRKK